ncbi:MAG: hypothetical protein KME07_13670 [Pegethrix bostrychoides GSE-TBD4-15B]|jgi:hypothetical protein|uniref:Uncharacterized protein n=1 Tax=Pegethrix bostrychoides GSE-TBD4-15B TaxID=2839662 RepID=A0A951U571_9CYAN|nr:hypothetical protein [Pegethrix bostrychoides GSE-TBD4-15B]
MLTQELAPEIVQEIDCETQRYLSEILVQENITAGELIRGLIRDRWIMLNPSLCASPTLRRLNSKQIIAEFLHRKCRSQHY